MRKFLLLAVAVVAMVSCTKTELVSTSNDGRIDFNVFFHKATKATDITNANISSFEVTAILNSAKYFDAVTVSKSGENWTYSPVQYWPSAGTVDFFAYAAGTGVTKDDYKTFTAAPASDAASQGDFVVARTQGSKTGSGNNAASGVTLNFRHAMSQVAVKVYNGNKNLQYDIYGWKVMGVDCDGTYSLNDADTDGGKVAYSNWTNNTGNYTACFYDDFTMVNKKNVSANEASTAAAAISGATEMILVPQKGVTKAAKYNAATSGAEMNGAYIAVDMVIKNSTDGTVVAGRQWCCWPVAFAWEPGYKYTYVIDLSQGGYKETNDGATETSPKANDDLDKVLENSAIVFTSVSVEAWDAVTDITVNM